MDIEKCTKSRGFTIIELVVVLAIIAVLAAVAQPIYNKVVDSAERSVCIHQMNQMQRLYYMYIFTNPGATITDALNGNCGDLSDNFALHTCPSGGVYSESEDGTIQCSIHGGLNGVMASSDGTPPLLPGTHLRIYNSYWPTPEDYADDPHKSIPVAAGGVFEYDGVYYIVTRDIELTKSQAGDGPGGVVYGWYATQELTGTVHEFPEGTTQINGVTRGDIVQVGDDTYVIFKDGGTWAFNPDMPNDQWYEIPNDWEE